MPNKIKYLNFGQLHQNKIYFFLKIAKKLQIKSRLML